MVSKDQSLVGSSPFLTNNPSVSDLNSLFFKMLYNIHLDF